jgi:hypothetical protein
MRSRTTYLPYENDILDFIIANLTTRDPKIINAMLWTASWAENPLQSLSPSSMTDYEQKIFTNTEEDWLATVFQDREMDIKPFKEDPLESINSVDNFDKRSSTSWFHSYIVVSFMYVFFPKSVVQKREYHKNTVKKIHCKKYV